MEEVILNYLPTVMFRGTPCIIVEGFPVNIEIKLLFNYIVFGPRRVFS